MVEKRTLRSHVEINNLDLRYEKFRLKSKRIERALLASIIEHDIQEPLKGIDLGDGTKILLDGFKRYRCAKKLNIGMVPYSSFGSDEPLGIIKLIRNSIARPLTILEQAKMIDELKKVHGMTHGDIADLLQKSKAWVSMRAGILGEMSEYVAKRVFNGDFPVYSFMYTLRKFIRMNSIRKNEIDEFVKLVAGKGLSIRDIELLANGFFKGSDNLRQQIKEGHITWGLNQLKKISGRTTECTNAEQKMLRDLESVQRYMQKITYSARNDRLGSDIFQVQASLLVQGVIDIMDNFIIAVRDLYDRCEQA
ncbi:MAG: chromosome partitioning protein ParB [Desulfobacula sp.]|uniref:ParB/RepB/Spo0J family partition protein n=1 Tax=Desulfobacula sp. TaxID=2593537 RepID=UPI0025C30F7D|nr:KorB domain-containing protein [Desulfobacula sp.]MCD4723057.1 chromosome partitioning protein ParB [Desulfobacula sp.]